MVPKKPDRTQMWIPDRWKRFGDVIRERRLKLGISQRQLGSDSGNSHGYVARMETGQVGPPSKEKVIAIALALGLSPDKLLLLSLMEPTDIKIETRRFRNVFVLIQRILALMDPREIADTIGLLEKRIALFDEEPIATAEKFKRFLLGGLGLSEDPGGGARPISHYIQPWGKEIEEWTPSESAEK